ncbi:CBM96 family carbohydrate-binding protein [Micromonospora auratinigra]|uniref:Heparinase II/III-like protein n=1 Tax=Micromonospora auratinigra TaxID=261654 RepID=A0A1A8ZJI3_9ACTN|nr:DNRLRE domain-containing protein [Micromonospora auratinigra]SBT44009.1 Heparinase II/III-like protein [Micromonospora auratinigra]
MIRRFTMRGNDMVERRQVLRATALAVAGGVAGFAVPRAASGAVIHPYLLVGEAEYPELRARAAQDPWLGWRAAAADLARQPCPTPAQEPDVGKRATRMSQIAGAASLAYVLDPADAALHRATLLGLIDRYRTEVRPYLDTTAWQGVVPPSSALFHLVLGLDVIVGSLTATQRSTAEATLADAAQWFHTYRNNGNWQAARIGGYGIWVAYAGDTARLDESLTQTLTHLDNLTSADGVYLTGPNYAGNRLGSAGDRDSKSFFVDVLTRIGSHDFYTDPQYVRVMEHYTGYLTTPVLRSGAHPDRGEYTFGDSWTERGTVHRSGRTWSAHRFGAVAAANAAWSLRGVPATETLPLITTYVLTTRTPATGTVPPSRVFPGGGAWFLQAGTSPLALAGALWNPTGDRQVEHQHKDTNALHLTAYGEHVLRNAGYAGYGTGVAGFSFEVISQRAVVNNTVLVDYPTTFPDADPPTVNDHQLTPGRLPGAGIVESLLPGPLDYACGDSGDALPNGATHLRSLVFVRPDQEQQGYWVVFDEVRGGTPNGSASVAWHPNSKSDPAVVEARCHYAATVDVNPCTSNGVGLSILLGTEPAQVVVRSGPLAEAWVANRDPGRYLQCVYPTDGAGAANAVTLLFPYDQAGHPRAQLDRVTGVGWTGVRVTHPSGVTDHAGESRGTATVTTAGVSWRGLACLFRLSGGTPAYWLVRRGRSLTWDSYGFQSTADVSLAMRGRGGRLHNPNAGPVTVTFLHPGLTKVRLNGVPAAVTATGIGWLSVTVPAGSAAVELVTATPVAPVADGYVRAGVYAADSYGRLGTLVVKADANPDYRRESYLRFDLSGLTGPVTLARLRLPVEATGGGACTLEVAQAATGWEETTLTWNSRPSATTVLATVPAPVAGTVLDLDVTAAARAVLAGGGGPLAVRLRIREDGANNSVTFGSREHTDWRRRPVLELS